MNEETFASAFRALDALEQEISRLEGLASPQFNETLRSLRASLADMEWDISYLAWELD